MRWAADPRDQLPRDPVEKESLGGFFVDGLDEPIHHGCGDGAGEEEYQMWGLVIAVLVGTVPAILVALIEGWLQSRRRRPHGLPRPVSR